MYLVFFVFPIFSSARSPKDVASGAKDEVKIATGRLSQNVHEILADARLLAKSLEPEPPQPTPASLGGLQSNYADKVRQ